MQKKNKKKMWKMWFNIFSR